MSLTSSLLPIAGAALALEVLRAHRQLGRNLDPSVRTREPVRYPSLTVIRPIRGLDVEANENIRAALDTGYPGACETLFVLDDEQEPALALIQQAMREARAAGRSVDARVLFAGRPPAGRTGKLNAMIVGLAGRPRRAGGVRRLGHPARPRGAARAGAHAAVRARLRRGLRARGGGAAAPNRGRCGLRPAAQRPLQPGLPLRGPPQPRLDAVHHGPADGVPPRGHPRHRRPRIRRGPAGRRHVPGRAHHEGRLSQRGLGPRRSHHPTEPAAGRVPVDLRALADLLAQRPARAWPSR